MNPREREGEGDVLRSTCAALGLAASPAQIEAATAYLALLRRWNTTYNLTAVRDPRAMLTQHMADCLAAVAALGRRTAERPPRRVVDVGSGGGLPGVLLAIFRPEVAVTCIDSVGKKAAFLRQVAGALALPNLHAEHGRVEDWRGEPFDLVTARAFASLADLARLTRRLLAPGGCWMAMKGAAAQAEIATLPPDIEVFHVEPLTVPGLDAQRCLVWMRPRRDSAAAPGH